MRSGRKGDFETRLLEKSGPGSQIWDQEKENTELIQNCKARAALFNLFFFFEEGVQL